MCCSLRRMISTHTWKIFMLTLGARKVRLIKKNTVLSIRQSLNRYFRDNGKKFDIIKDPAFTDANKSFKALMRKTRIDGKGSVKHHDAISVPDIRKMYSHEYLFNPKTPTGLVNKVFFEIVLYFCRRGQENLTELLVDDFQVICLDDGRKCVTKCTSELTKNHQGDSSETEGTGGEMFATGTELCPVASFEKYLSKRPKSEDFKRLFFLHSKDDFNDNDDVWYRKEPMGKDYLGGMMKKFSHKAELSKADTNHCIRATCITILNHCGFESRHIATVSGHRNRQSLASYCYDTSDYQKEAMSNALSLCTSAKPVGPSGMKEVENIPPAAVTLQPQLSFPQPIPAVDGNPYPLAVMQSQMNRMQVAHTSVTQGQLGVTQSSSLPLQVSCQANHIDEIPDIDFLDDQTLVSYTDRIEKNYQVAMPAPKMPSFNFNNCVVNIHMPK